MNDALTSILPDKVQRKKIFEPSYVKAVRYRSPLKDDSLTGTGPSGTPTGKTLKDQPESQPMEHYTNENTRPIRNTGGCHTSRHKLKGVRVSSQEKHERGFDTLSTHPHLSTGEDTGVFGLWCDLCNKRLVELKHQALKIWIPLASHKIQAANEVSSFCIDHEAGRSVR